MRINWNLNVWAIIVSALIGFQLLDFNITWFMAKILSHLSWIKWDSYLCVVFLSTLRSSRFRGN